MNVTLRPLPALLRRQRLPLLCASSALLHLAALAWLAALPPRPRQEAARLTVRLDEVSRQSALMAPLHAAPAPAPAPAPGPAETPAAAAEQPAPPARRLPNTPAATAMAAMTRATTTVPPVMAVTPMTPATPAATAPVAALPGWDVSAAGDATEAAHLPGFQAVQAPPPARLTYAVTTAQAGGPERAGGSASLEWRLLENGYSLAMTGVSGQFASTGQMSDNGFVPLSSSARASDGATDTVQFDWSAAQASFGRSGAQVLVASDGQDRASMLMRLAGMGLAGAAQLAGTIELQVAGSDGLATVRFERIGDEELISTAIGAVRTVHLAQQSAPGQARLDVWLAPQYGWHPVRLKVTAADGSSATQTVTALTMGAAD